MARGRGKKKVTDEGTVNNSLYKEFFVQKQDENLTFKIFANKGMIKIMKVS